MPPQLGSPGALPSATTSTRSELLLLSLLVLLPLVLLLLLLLPSHAAVGPSCSLKYPGPSL
jgi:hypothetical protein